MDRKQAKTQTGASDTSGTLAIARRNWFMNWYRELGFSLQIPVPPVPDEEYKSRKEQGQDLFYRPPTSEVSYEALMKAVGQGKCWTVVNGSDRKKIKWEPTQTGYWFWAEVSQDCPRLGTSWHGLTRTKEQGLDLLSLLSLEEYALVWWAHKAATNAILDTGNWSWLRTRFRDSALHASDCYGRVCVDGWDAISIAYPYVNMGGRSAEVVKM
ncbi:hypothetical protein HYT45_03825 [Candidatus Uhrbacteria bacterium]|nr:hypothetical protein [Candidatus Uhrbacteria bacterium]